MPKPITLTLRFEPELVEQIRRAAKARYLPMSQWLKQSALAALHAQGIESIPSGVARKDLDINGSNGAGDSRF